MGDFSVREIEELRAACSGEEKIGYFSPEAKLEPVWMEPILSSWAALAERKFIRLNQLQTDRSGMQRRYWEESAPASYVGAHGLEWSNTAEVIMGFARKLWHKKRHGVEGPSYTGLHSPVLGSATPRRSFTLYKIIEVPERK